MAERRQVERVKTTNGALIFSDQQRGILSCTLRDISDTGVGLRLNDQDIIAPTFKITLDNFRNVRTCQVIWSRGRYIGPTFERLSVFLRRQAVMMWALGFAGLLVCAVIVMGIRRHSRYLDELNRRQVWRIDPEG